MTTINDDEPFREFSTEPMTPRARMDKALAPLEGRIIDAGLIIQATESVLEVTRQLFAEGVAVRATNGKKIKSFRDCIVSVDLDKERNGVLLIGLSDASKGGAA